MGHFDDGQCSTKLWGIIHQFIINRKQLLRYLFFFGGLRCDKYSREETVVFLVFESELTVFPWIVSAETVLFWKWKMLKFYTVSTLCQFFYFMNSRYTTIQGRKILISRTFLLQVFKGNNYLKKYGTSCCNILTYYLMKWIFAAHLTWHMRKYGTNIARIAL